MSGNDKPTRTQARLAREDRLAIYIAQGRPVSAVAKSEVIEHDYAYKLLREVAAKRGLTYQPRRGPRAEIVGLTSASQQLRARLGDALYKLKDADTDLTRSVGILAKSQPYAHSRPFNYDWSLSQLERLATATGLDFRTMLLQMLQPTEENKAA